MKSSEFALKLSRADEMQMVVSRPEVIVLWLTGKSYIHLSNRNFALKEEI